MSQKKFTNATGNWTVGQNDEINYSGKAKLEGAIQATDFLDADGNSIIGATEYVNVDTELKNLKVGTLPIGSSGEYSVAVGMQANFGGYVTDYAVGVGIDAKATTSAVAVGMGTEARPNAVAIGRGAQAWDNSMAIGAATWATYDHSIALGRGAKTEEDQQVMFGATPDFAYGKTLNLKTYGTMQATDFLDADGNSIIIRSGNYLPFTRGDYWFDEYDIPDILIADESFVGDGIYAKSLMADNLRISYGPISSRGGLRSDMLAGYFSGAQSFTIENTVFGGINITAVDADRPDELPFDLSDEEAMFLKSKTRSAQHALTVTHETLGRTVEIDKEGIIRANAFTDMEGSPLMETLTQAEYDALTPNANTVYFII